MARMRRFFASPTLSRFAQPVSLDLAAYAGMEPVEMLGYVPFPTVTDRAVSVDARALFISLAGIAGPKLRTQRVLPDPQSVPVTEVRGTEAIGS